MADISFLIGSGFSIPAGYPSTQAINDKFSTIKESQIFVHTDMTAMFVEEGKKIDTPRLGYVDEVFIERFIKFYCEQVIDGGEFNYERFFDYYHSHYRKNTYGKKLDQFLTSFKQEFKSKRDHLNTLGHFNTYFNQLLKNYINKSSQVVNIQDKYMVFSQLINSLLDGNVLHFHTLNHDLLLESFNYTFFNGELSDGFEELGSPYYGKMKEDYMVRLPRFTNKYVGRHRLYKLHGSVDNYDFHYEKDLEMIKSKHEIGLTDFYKEVSISNELQYHNNWSASVPKFLTGTLEKTMQYNRLYYNDQFEHFDKNLLNSELLIIFGYGFGDAEINKKVNKNFIDIRKKVLIVSHSTPTSDFYHEILSLDNVKHYHRNIEEMDFDEVVKMLVEE